MVPPPNQSCLKRLVGVPNDSVLLLIGTISLCVTITPVPPPVFNATSVFADVEILKLALTTGRTVVTVIPFTGTPSGNTLSVMIYFSYAPVPTNCTTLLSGTAAPAITSLTCNAGDGVVVNL